ELAGDPETKITGAASLAEATVHEISFFNNPRYLAQLRKTRAAAVIVPPDFSEQIGAAVIRVQNPAKAFEQVVTKFAPPPIKFAAGIHPSAVIHPRAKLGDHISIQPVVVIEAGARIGSRAVIGAGSDIGHDVVIGEDTVIAAQTGIAGSVRIGTRVVIGGQVGNIGHVEIADGTLIGAQTGVSKNLNGGVWWATPSVPLKEAKVQLAWVRRLGEF